MIELITANRESENDMSHLNAQRRGFTKGAGATYVCRCCKRVTRPTGTGDNDGVRLCVECYDLAGEENHLSDNGCFYATNTEVLATIAAVVAKGGDASRWADLKRMAERGTPNIGN